MKLFALLQAMVKVVVSEEEARHRYRHALKANLPVLNPRVSVAESDILRG